MKYSTYEKIQRYFLLNNLCGPTDEDVKEMLSLYFKMRHGGVER